jgi:hypothetical protein
LFRGGLEIDKILACEEFACSAKWRLEKKKFEMGKTK